MFTGHASRAAETAAHHADTTRHPGRRPRVLLLEGNPASLGALERSLSDCRATTVSAADGATGVERLLEEFLHLDALVMDLDLPLRDARAIAHLIRGAGNEQDLAIVVLAYAPSAALRAELRRLGVDAVVDRRDGPAAAATAALAAVEARRGAEAIELEPWRCATPRPGAWLGLGAGELAGA
jgi:CheY-like chemotaxis protein